tara:strand:- start:193 stop:402 length:210 start_codon:yes stop_codon:yes gene_type:complete
MPPLVSHCVSIAFHSTGTGVLDASVARTRAGAHPAATLTLRAGAARAAAFERAACIRRTMIFVCRWFEF